MEPNSCWTIHWIQGARFLQLLQDETSFHCFGKYSKRLTKPTVVIVAWEDISTAVIAVDTAGDGVAAVDGDTFDWLD